VDGMLDGTEEIPGGGDGAPSVKFLDVAEWAAVAEVDWSDPVMVLVSGTGVGSSYRSWF
jgi:hypothetical protein